MDGAREDTGDQSDGYCSSSEEKLGARIVAVGKKRSR